MATLFINRRRAPAWLIDVGQRLEALFMGGLWWFAARLSPSQASALGRILFNHLGPRTRKHRWVLGNLRVAFPQRPIAEIRTLGREVWANFGAWLLEYPHLPTIALDGLEIVHPDGDPSWMKQGGPWIFVGAHLANVELTGLAGKALGITADAVYSPLANPHMDAKLRGFREIHENRLIPKQNALRSLMRSLKAGRSVGLVVDVRTDDGLLCPFFGIPAPTTHGPAWLALKLHLPIVPMAVERVGDARFRMHFYPPLSPPKIRDEAQALEALTTAMNQAIARTIAAHPGQWWCGKRRWPRSAYRDQSG